MRRPPPMNAWIRFPVTSVIAVLAGGASVLWWENADASWLLMDSRTWDGELWRPFTSMFPHVDVIHLGFNVYWLWVFGTLVEETYGHMSFLGIVALFAFGSSTAEYAFSLPGVGLSGVGYGLFAMLWVLSRKDERFRDAIDGRTIALWVAWFFLCILLTEAGIWQVGNVAHGAGALQGAVLGLAVTAGRQRVLWAALSSFLPLIFLLAATLGQPYVNFSQAPEYAQWKKAYDAYNLQTLGQHEKAIDLYLEVLKAAPDDARSWYNLVPFSADTFRVARP